MKISSFEINGLDKKFISTHTQTKIKSCILFSCQEVDSSYAAYRNNGTGIEGSDIIEKLNVSRTVGENVGVLLLFVAIFRILTYFSLRYLHKPK